MQAKLKEVLSFNDHGVSDITVRLTNKEARNVLLDTSMTAEQVAEALRYLAFEVERAGAVR